MLKVILPGTKIRFDYINYNGVTETREVIFRGIDHGSNEWYPEPKWLLRAHDPSRGAVRSFALENIDEDSLEIIG